jgi:hypothetical protein
MSHKNLTITIKHIKSSNIYIITGINNKIIGEFPSQIRTNDSSSFSSSLLNYFLFLKYLSLFGLLPNNNYKEFNFDNV